MLKFFLPFFAASFVWAATSTVRGQDDDGGVLVINNPSQGGGTSLNGGTPTGGTPPVGGGTYTLGGYTLGGSTPADTLSLLPTSAGSSPWTVVEGSTLTFNLDLYGGGAADVHSFAIDIGSVSDLDLTTITTNLPTGYSYSYNNGVFSGTNVSGTDISSAQITLYGGTVTTVTDAVTQIATLTFTLDPSATPGSTLDLPELEADTTLSDSSGNSIPVDLLMSNSGPLVVAPEPPCFWMIAAGGCALALLGIRQRSLTTRRL